VRIDEVLPPEALTIGWAIDLRYLFRQLRIRAANPSDDGRVETMEPTVKEKLR